MKNKLLKLTIASLGIAALSILTTSCSNSNSPANTNENILYVSSDATESGDGSSSNPYTFQNAILKANPGDTIALKAGTYTSSSRIGVYRSGSPNYEITVRPENEGDTVIFDFSSMTFDGSNRGIQIYGDYWHFENIEITGAGDNGMYIAGSYNTIENCMFYNNRDTGLQLGRAYSSDNSIDTWPSYNLIKNCTSFANYDAETYGENADGFAAKLTIGYGNVFDGCIAFRNSDDGWDLYAKEDSGNIGTVMLYNCVSFENGYLPYTIDRTSNGTTYKSYNTMNGDGIGFKLGGSTMEGDVIIENCIAFNNKLHGFSDNSNPGVINIKNSTAINNCMGINEDGTVGSRGIDGDTNKSNNFDLARSTSSYNNYYGLLSYVNNQSSFKANGDSSYNSDAFKGSMAYSILNTSYSSGEVYTAFTSYVDSSSYSSDDTDSAFSLGTTYTGTLNDSCFASTKAINAICSSASDVASLKSIHTTYRNSDGSVNLGDTWKITDSSLLTYANGEAIGHNLSKSSYDEYTHYETSYFEGCTTRDEVKVASAYSVLEIAADEDAIYQDFEMAKRIHGCEIEWTSSNPDVISIDNNEEISASTSVYISGVVNCPATDTNVTLTAVITCGEATKTKTFNVVVKSRNQTLGALVNKSSSVIKVSKYASTYVEPKFYVEDGSSSTLAELPSSLYELSYTYQYATDKNSKFYNVDGVYTSVSGVYKVTVTATSKIESDNGKTSESIYYVYIVDPDCNIDFSGTPSLVLNNEGLTISANLSNVYGYLYVLVSNDQLEVTPTYEELIANEEIQTFDINTDTISASVIADNNTATGYYLYYVLSNHNGTYYSEVVETQINVVSISTNDDFYSLATQAKVNGEAVSNTTIYSLTTDLDFADYSWDILESGNGTFNGLFNGNGHTIKNLTISGSGTKNINIFYKVSGGTIMNTVFENISIKNTSDTGKQIGIIGELQGGYIADIIAVNVSAVGYQGAGGIIGAVTGGINYVSGCTLDNRNTEAVIATSGKYAGGIVGNGQKNTEASDFELHINNCAVYATIGDGSDTGGNTGGIIGRVKNDSTIYLTDIEHCVFVGTVIAKGQYNAGICGDFDNGIGTVRIYYCYSDATFVYSGEILDARKADVDNEETQSYAHKNSNPIVGRAVATDTGEYDTGYNYGTWKEYYSKYISSTGWCFASYYGVDYVFKETFFKNVMKFDLDHTWVYSSEGFVYLQNYNNYLTGSVQATE